MALNRPTGVKSMLHSADVMRTVEQWLRRLSVAQRVAAILALLLLPLAALSVVTVFVLNEQELAFRQSVQESIQTLLPLTTLQTYLERAQVDELEAQSNEATPHFSSLTHKIDSAFSSIEQSDPGADLPNGLIVSARQAWRTARPSVLRLIRHVRPQAAGGVTLGDIQSRRDLGKAIADVARAREHLAHIVRVRYEHAVAMRKAELMGLLAAWIITLTIAAVLIALFLYSILKPIRSLESAARRLGQGESNVSVATLGSDELTAVAERFNEMAAYWHDTHEELVTQTSMDPLTGVLNRRGIDAVLAEALNSHRPFLRPMSVFIMDLDRFKAINDTFGHSAGDRALLWVAERMREALRDNDRLGRYGGDEFFAVLPDTTLDQARHIAERTSRFIAAQAAGKPMYPTVTIGVAATPDDGWDVTALVGSADKRLYEAKSRRPPA